MHSLSRVTATTFALASALAATAPLAAQEMRPALTSASAKAIVLGCEAFAKDKGIKVAITVLDHGGDPAAFLRMDGVNLGPVDISRWKADAAASWAWPTRQMSEIVSKGGTGFAFAPHVSTFEGGEPIFSADGKVPLGGVGVSGASSADDAACARAGIAAAGLTHAAAPKN